ncbi:MAG: methyltransferase [Mangrovicoccus sp.]
MTRSRLKIAHDLAAFSLPTEGEIAIFGAPGSVALQAEFGDRLHYISTDRPAYAAIEAAGGRVSHEAGTGYAAAVVMLPRAKAAAKWLIGQAAGRVVPGGLVLVDGQKTDGIETAVKECKSRLTLIDSYVKAHGRLFWFHAAPGLEDWAELHLNWPKPEGYQTAPGVFSADGIDPGSAALIEDLTGPLKGHGADFGAGWGYLSKNLLQAHPGIKQLDLVEADLIALEAAKVNIDDPRAQFHWADATTWQASGKLDFVITNPPFHSGREATPDLGKAFLRQAASNLAPRGVLWAVANKQLPYESLMEELFQQTEFRRVSPGYKVLIGQRPKR